MAGGVVVAVLFSLRFISVLDPASAQNCTAADHVVEEGNVQTVYQSNAYTYYVWTSLFVQPGTDFEGVSVEVTQLSNTKFEAWFPVDQCYPNDATWVQLKVEVETKVLKNPLYYYLSFTTTIGYCTKTCTRYPTFYYIRSLSVVARGSSKWRCTCPATTCLAPQVSNESPNKPMCMEPPGLHRTPKTLAPATSSSPIPTTTQAPIPTTTQAPIPTTTQAPIPTTTQAPIPTTTQAPIPTTTQAPIPTTTEAPIPTTTQAPIPTTSQAAIPKTRPAADSTTPVTTTTPPYSTLLIIVVVMVVAMLVVVVVGIVFRRMRRAAASEGGGPCDAPDARSPEHVSMNSLYEPSGVYHNTAAVKDEKETTRPCTNSLYEPFNGLMYAPGGRDQQDMTRTSTNSLYEPFNGLMYAPGGRDQQDMTRTNTNSLYEPFNGLMYAPGGRDQQDMTRTSTNSLYEAFSEPIYDRLQWDT